MSGFARWGGRVGGRHRWNFVIDLSAEPAAWEHGAVGSFTLGKLSPLESFHPQKGKPVTEG